MIAVSYFSSKAPKERKVCIAKKRPRFFSGPCVPEFAPENPWDLDNWQARYRGELETRFPDAASLQAVLDRIAGQTPEPILCCYEKAPSECHRTILAEFINERLGLNVQEWAA